MLTDPEIDGYDVKNWKSVTIIYDALQMLLFFFLPSYSFVFILTCRAWKSYGITKNNWNWESDLLPFGPESFFLPFVIQKYKDKNLRNYSYGWETWSHMLKKGYGLEGVREWVMRKILEPKRMETTGGWSNCTVRSFMILPFTKYYTRDKIKNNEVDWTCSTCTWEEKTTWKT